ncbi:MAG: hypothetical protein LBU27_04070 [Candidatus Peribacteria bacterium]|nr:hypothetical protein [Candidatus Peribacteria bacterium]
MQKCRGNNNLLHAFIYSCNIGMVRVVQKVGKEIFYNYLAKFGFGKLTGIELAEEKPGFIDNETTVSAARFLNNSFGQGLQVTQIQLAAAYGVLINGGQYIKPTIVSGIAKKTANSEEVQYTESLPQILSQIIRPEVSEEMKSALFNIMTTNTQYASAQVKEYRLGAKSGTAQIAFRGKYQRGNGWTQATFAGAITMDDPKYLVLIWVSRPRSSQW